MIKNHDYSEFPDIHKYAQLEDLSPEVLVKAFRIEEKYNKLLLNEKSFDKRLNLYDEFYSILLPTYGRDSEPTQHVNPKDKYVRLFTRELRGKNIIDYGCGQGNMLLSIERQLKVKSLTGIDIVIPNELKSHQRIHFVEGNIINYSFKSKFDVAFSDNVLEHLVPEDAFLHLKNIFENLNSGGKLIIIMPNRLFGPWDVTRIKDFSQSGRLAAQGGHVNESSHMEMTQQLKEVGFTKVSTIVPIPKLKYSLFQKSRIDTRWVETIENTPWLLKLFKLVKFKGVCQIKFPVTLIAEK